jgi:hypothetical protein
MAKLVQNNVLVTLSRVVKDSDAVETTDALSNEQVAALEAVVAEIVGSGVVVEVQLIPDA